MATSTPASSRNSDNVLDKPIQLGKVSVMVINPVYGTVSMFIPMDAEKMVLTSKEEKAEYASKCTDVAMRYLRLEGFIDPKKRSKWKVNYQIAPK